SSASARTRLEGGSRGRSRHAQRDFGRRAPRRALPHARHASSHRGARRAGPRVESIPVHRGGRRRVVEFAARPSDCSLEAPPYAGRFRVFATRCGGPKARASESGYPRAVAVIKNVMLVDDEPDIRTIGAMSLRRVGKWEVQLASSGAEAVALAKQSVPDLV